MSQSEDQPLVDFLHGCGFLKIADALGINSRYWGNKSRVFFIEPFRAIYEVHDSWAAFFSKLSFSRQEK